MGGLSKATEGFGMAGVDAVDSVGVAGVTGDVTFAGAAISNQVIKSKLINSKLLVGVAVFCGVGGA